MPDFEDLRMADLLKKFKNDVEHIVATHSLGGIKKAGEDLQTVYNFFITAQNPYEGMEEKFKSLFSSFNYAAVIVNNAIKQGGLKGDDNELLTECMQIMTKCADDLIREIGGV